MLCLVLIEGLFSLCFQRCLPHLLSILPFGSDLAIIEEVGDGLVRGEMIDSFGELLTIVIFAVSGNIILLEGFEVLFELVVVSLMVTCDGAVQLIVVNLALPLGLCIELLSLNALCLDYFLEALLSFGLSPVEAFVDVCHLLLYKLFMAFLHCFVIDCFFCLILIDFVAQLSKQVLVNFFELFNVSLCIVEQFQLFLLQLLVFLLESFDEKPHFALYLGNRESTPTRLRISVSDFCSIFYNLRYSSSNFLYLASSMMTASRVLMQAEIIYWLSVMVFQGVCRLLSLQMVLIFSRMLLIVNCAIDQQIITNH